MWGYIKNVLNKYNCTASTKSRYGAKVQHTAPHRQQRLVRHRWLQMRPRHLRCRALLWYGHAVDNKLFVALSAIGSQQAEATEAKSTAIDQLHDYVATYPNDGIKYRASDMLLSGHDDAGLLNKSKAQSRASTHIFLSDDTSAPPSLQWPDPNHRRNHQIRHMSSAAEAELAALSIAAKKMAPLP